MPLASHIVNELKTHHSGRVAKNFFLHELEGHFTEQEAQRVLDTLIDWARYAEILHYDANSGLLSLEDVR